MVTIPRFCIKLEPVGCIFVYPPLSPTYTTSPSVNSEVLTPFTNPMAIPKPASLSAKVSLSMKVAGIVEASEAEAAITVFSFPTDPVTCTGVPFCNVVPETFFTCS